MSASTASQTVKVLIADDDSAIIDAITILLEDEGYAVSTVTNGDVFQETRLVAPDVVLLDIWMSGQDGRDVCRQLKANDATREIPVIVFSANPAVARLATEAGADDFLAKPFDLDVLLEKLGRWAGRAGAVGRA